MSTPQPALESKPKRVRQRFHRATAAEQAQGVPLPKVTADQKVLAEFLPITTLKALACQHNALDERERKLTCVMFLWLMVLAVGAGGPINLTKVLTFTVVACLMTDRPVRQAVLSKETLSENLQHRPWQFFQAVLQYLLAAYAAFWATPQGITTLALIEHLLLIDATVMRVANTLIQTFPANRTGRRALWAAVKLHLVWRLERAIPEVVTITAQKVNERKVSFLQAVGQPALYVFDLGYWWYKLFDEIILRKQHFISRMRDGCNPLIKEVYIGCQEWVGKRLNDICWAGTEIDLLVNVTGPYSASPRMIHDVRLVGQWVDKDQVWHFYITSLWDRLTYTVSLIAEIYALRWQIEILFRDLKCVLGITNFLSTSENGVRIQIYAALIHYVLTRLVILKASRQSNIPVEEFSIPYCLAVVGQVMTQTVGLVIKGHTPDWATLETRLVEAVIAIGRRPNRKRGHRLLSVKSHLQNKPVPTAASP